MPFYCSRKEEQCELILILFTLTLTFVLAHYRKSYPDKKANIYIYIYMISFRNVA